MTPNQAEMERMKTNTPEMYKAYVKAIGRTVKSDIYMREAPYRVPSRIAHLGQLCGLIAVLAILGLAGFAVYKGSTVLAGILVAVDIVAVAAVFNGNSSGAHSKKK